MGKESILKPENNNSWICCLQCNQWWHSSCNQILSKDLVKYSKYHIHYSCLFYVVKEVSSNKNINLKLNTILITSNININKAADAEQGTNKAVNKVSKSSNLTLSRTTVSKNISHSEKRQNVTQFQGPYKPHKRNDHSVTQKLLTLLNWHQIHKQKARDTLTTTSNTGVKIMLGHWA